MTPEVLKTVLHYSPGTGRFTWRERGLHMFTDTDRWTADQHRRRWNTKYAGKPALNAPKGNGYLHGPVLRKYLLAHRVAWAVFYGEWPEHQIDHLNGDRSDNRISNLRDATPTLNARNRGLPSPDYPLGVIQGESGNWYARIRGDAGKSLHLGTFPTMETAVAARKAAENRLSYQRNYGGRV